MSDPSFDKLAHDLVPHRSRQLVMRYVHPSNFAQVVDLLERNRISTQNALKLLDIYVARSMVKCYRANGANRANRANGANRAS